MCSRRPPSHRPEPCAPFRPARPPVLSSEANPATGPGSEPAIVLFRAREVLLRGFRAFTAAAAATASATPAFCSSTSRSIRTASSPAPSFSSASIERRIERSASSNWSSTVTTSADALNLPSRNSPSRFSPACASFSSRVYPRKPVVPLMVWTERKISAISAASSGRFSRSVRQRSIRSSPSWLSITNSRVSSSIAVFSSHACLRIGDIGGGSVRVFIGGSWGNLKILLARSAFPPHPIAPASLLPWRDVHGNRSCISLKVHSAWEEDCND
jgi:hypothetical protein